MIRIKMQRMELKSMKEKSRGKKRDQEEDEIESQIKQ